jgi:hypothetical protein
MTGSYIAQTRAEIDILRQRRDYDSKPALMALKHLQATMQHSKNYNPKSYEAKRLNKEIKNCKANIDEINYLIKELQLNLKYFIDPKDKAYRKAENK